MKRSLILSITVILLSLVFGIQAVLAFTGMELVSVSSNGVPGDSYSYDPAISADGRYVTFGSAASNLVSPATDSYQIFVRDRLTGTTTLASANAGGTQGNSDSYEPDISAAGRYIAFYSDATDLVSPATSGYQIFRRDRQTGTTTLVSANASGVQGNNGSYEARISADGRYVTFYSHATNLVSPATSGQQVFVRDMQTGTTRLVSADAGGIQGNKSSERPRISADGRYIIFYSEATNLVSPATSGQQVFMRDMQTGTTTLVSANASGVQGNAESYSSSISANGRYVTFHSRATNLVSPATSRQNVFMRDMQTGTTTLVSANTVGVEGDNDSYRSIISADGRYITFSSEASDLVSPATSGEQVFMRDMQTGTTTLVSANASGVQGDNDSYSPCISADGRYVAFASYAYNLVSPATSQDHVYVTGSPYIPPAPDTRIINATAGANGSISPAGRVTVNVGASQAFTITANAGYRVADVLVDGISVGAVSTYTFTNVTADHTISASFASNLIGTGSRSSGTISAPTVPQGPVNLANLRVASATVSASRVGPGEIVTVTANVANQGTGNGSMLVKLYVNGQEEASQGITVNSGSSAPVTFTLSRNEPGAYSVYVGGVSAGSFTVESDPNIILYISIAMIFISIAGIVYFTRRRQAV